MPIYDPSQKVNKALAPKMGEPLQALDLNISM